MHNEYSKFINKNFMSYFFFLHIYTYGRTHLYRFEFLSLYVLRFKLTYQYFFYRFLIESGADLSAVNNDCELPVDIAEDSDVEEMLRQYMNDRSVYFSQIRFHIYAKFHVNPTKT